MLKLNFLCHMIFQKSFQYTDYILCIYRFIQKQNYKISIQNYSMTPDHLELVTWIILMLFLSFLKLDQLGQYELWITEKAM